MNNIEKLEVQSEYANKHYQLIKGSIELSFSIKNIAENYCAVLNCIKRKEEELSNCQNKHEEEYIRHDIYKFKKELNTLSLAACNMGSYSDLDAIYQIIFTAIRLYNIATRADTTPTESELKSLYEALHSSIFTIHHSLSGNDPLVEHLIIESMPNTY